MLHTHSGILLSHKKNEILHFAVRRMYLESIRLSEISETEKDKHCILSQWNLKNRTNKSIQQYRNRLRYREQTSSYQWGERRARQRQESERHKLPLTHV